jgi:hypothetical protein
MALIVGTMIAGCGVEVFTLATAMDFGPITLPPRPQKLANQSRIALPLSGVMPRDFR